MFLIYSVITKESSDYKTYFFININRKLQLISHCKGKMLQFLISNLWVRIWRSVGYYIEHGRDSPKVNVFCAIFSSKVYGPFFFAEKSIRGITYLDMLEIWLFLDLKEDVQNFVFQQDGAPSHWHSAVCKFLNRKLPQHWIGGSEAVYLALHTYLPMSPDLTACDFFLWEYIKYIVFILSFPISLAEMKQWCFTNS